jgi:enolase
VSTAVANVNTEISKLLAGEDPSKQAQIDAAMIELDGTPNKGRLGANAILGASLAIAKAGAAARGTSLFDHFAHLADRTSGQMRLPTPCLNVINGGEVRERERERAATARLAHGNLCTPEEPCAKRPL